MSLRHFLPGTPNVWRRSRCHVVASHRLGNKNQPKGFPASGNDHHYQYWNVRLSGHRNDYELLYLGPTRVWLAVWVLSSCYLMAGRLHDHLHSRFSPNGSKLIHVFTSPSTSSHLLWVSYAFVYPECFQSLRKQLEFRPCTRSQ
jgi:hypothetical protein